MTTKRHFILLSMVIPSLQSITSAHFVFIEPLLEELLELWNVGMEIVDANAYHGSTSFKLQAILLSIIYDFPAYGIVSKLVMKGFLGCPICGPSNILRRSTTSAKNIWDCMHKKFLSLGHQW